MYLHPGRFKLSRRGQACTQTLRKPLENPVQTSLSFLFLQLEAKKTSKKTEGQRQGQRLECRLKTASGFKELRRFLFSCFSSSRCGSFLLHLLLLLRLPSISHLSAAAMEAAGSCWVQNKWPGVTDLTDESLGRLAERVAPSGRLNETQSVCVSVCVLGEIESLPFLPPCCIHTFTLIPSAPPLPGDPGPSPPPTTTSEIGLCC